MSEADGPPAAARELEATGYFLPSTRRTSATREVPNLPGHPWRNVRFCQEKLEAPSGFEPEMEVLQTSALPLGDGALLRERTSAGTAACVFRQD